MRIRWQALNPFSRSDAGEVYGEMCRAYGVLPHELPPRGTPERRFMESEWRERVQDQNERAKKQQQPGSPGRPGIGRRMS